MDAVEAVKERISVEDVVGEYVALKRAGRNFKGLCPFHSEKTPSFMVNPERNIYHCFGCNEGGDAISFIMKIEGLEFRQALELLARKAGVDLAQYGRGSGLDSQQKDKLLALIELTVRYYQATLARNQHALDYALKRRGLRKQTLADFGVGYAPLAGTALVDFLIKRGHKLADIKQAGLIASQSRTPRDLFRGRLVLPLADGQGKAIGFTGRLIDAQANGPKYLNSPQTPIYDKSRHIFGLHMAKQAIREGNLAVLVEGNMDVVASHQAGIKNVVAAAGTALTLEQLRQLSRLTENIILAFDNDAAGLNATLRAIELAQKVRVNLSVAVMAGGKDPDELIRQDPKKWQAVIDGAVYAMDWLFAYHLGQHDAKSAPGKRQISAALLPVIEMLADPVEQEHYRKQLASALDVSLEAVKAGRTNSPKRLKAAKTEPKQIVSNLAILDTYLALISRFRETRVSLAEVKLTGLDEPRQTVFSYISSHPAFDAAKALPKELLAASEFVKILLFKAEELYGGWTTSDRVVEAIDLAQRLGQLTKRQALKDLSKKIETAEAAGDQKVAGELLGSYHALLREE